MAEKLAAPNWREPKEKISGKGGRRVRVSSKDHRGAYVRSGKPEHGTPLDIAIDATLRSAATKGKASPGSELAIEAGFDDIRVKKRRRKIGASIIFLLDSSGSMGVNRRMSLTKGAVLELLDDAYRRRDRVALISCRSESASVELPFTSSISLAEERLSSLPTGGRTPLAAGLRAASQAFNEELRRNPDAKFLLVVISDGKANVASATGISPSEELQSICESFEPRSARCLIVDTESGLARFGMAKRMATWLNAELLALDSLNTNALAEIITQRIS